MKAITLLFCIFWQLNGTAATKENIFDKLNPKDPNIENLLAEIDRDYEETTGKPSHLNIDLLEQLIPTCYRNSCPIWADVDKSAQIIYIYIDGVLSYYWKTSTGKAGYRTPDMDTHPDGRIYDRYTSTKFPGGDYNGLGNMPYAVFIRGGYAIHGTTIGNWGKLGTPASHGCVRIHPNNGQIFNRLVRANGVGNVWITVN